jgi:hypothetical protein
MRIRNPGRRSRLLTGEGGGVGVGVAAKSYDGETAWFSINHLVPLPHLNTGPPHEETPPDCPTYMFEHLYFLFVSELASLFPPVVCTKHCAMHRFQNGAILPPPPSPRWNLLELGHGGLSSRTRLSRPDTPVQSE